MTKLSSWNQLKNWFKTHKIAVSYTGRTQGYDHYFVDGTCEYNLPYASDISMASSARAEDAVFNDIDKISKKINKLHKVLNSISTFEILNNVLIILACITAYCLSRVPEYIPAAEILGTVILWWIIITFIGELYLSTLTDKFRLNKERQKRLLELRIVLQGRIMLAHKYQQAESMLAESLDEISQLKSRNVAQANVISGYISELTTLKEQLNGLEEFTAPPTKAT